VSRSRAKGTAADRTCQRCGGPRDGTRYCRPCAAIVMRERGMHPERRKPCPECGQPKEPGKRRYCIACWTKRQPRIKIAERDRARFKSRKQRLERGVQPRQPKVNPEGQVRCSLCQQYLPPHEFSQLKNGRYHAQCRSCYSTYLHEQRLQVVFGLTIEAYEQLLAQQEGRCAICMRQPRTRRLAVDHDHETNEIRGLLCTRCNNKILGAAQESPSLLRRAARYLEAPPARTGAGLEALGDETDQRQRAFIEAAEELEPADVLAYDGTIAVHPKTLAVLAQAAGWALVIEGRELLPDPQMAIDDMALLDKTWVNAKAALEIEE
jgi:Recombination endonuclease VII